MSTDNERRQDLGLPVIPEASPKEHHCVKGWLGETTDGQPVPCLTCRPWLRKRGHDQTFPRPRQTTNTPTQKDNR